MKLVVQVKLLPTPLQAAALEATLHACNEAASWVSGVAFVKDVKRNFALREHTYTEIKQRWGLGAQAAQHVIKKTCDAYRTLAANAKAGNLGKPWSKRYRRATEKPITGPSNNAARQPRLTGTIEGSSSTNCAAAASIAPPQ